MGKNFVVHIVGPFCKRKNVPLGQVVLVPKVRVAKHSVVVKVHVARELVACHGLKVFALWRVDEVANHECCFNWVAAHAARVLVLINEGDLCASGVEQRLVNHIIGLF